jgi:hypothetical protein
MTFVPQNLSSRAAVLQNCSGKNTDSFRVFLRKAFYRRRGSAPMVSLPSTPLQLSFGPHPSSGKNRSLGLCFVQF